MTGNRKLAKRYAQALGELAVDQSALDIVQEQFGRIASAMEQDARLRSVIANKRIPAEAKREILFQLAGEQPSDLMQMFLRLVLQKRREVHLPAMYEEYVLFADEVRGVLMIEVRTAKPLDANEMESLRNSLSQYTGADVRLVNEVAPDIIGGVVARVGDLVIDGSVAGRLARLKQTLQQTRLQNVG